MVSLFRALANLIRIALAPLWWPIRWLSRPKGDWVYLRVQPSLIEFADEQPWWRRLPGAPRKLRSTELAGVRTLFKHVSQQASVRGCLIEIRSLHSGWSACLALRTAIVDLRRQGKQVCVYLPFGGSNRELFVALAADRVFVSPEASLMLLGLSARATYWAALLERVGVRVEAHAEGGYKTAAERFTRTSMSDAEREQLGALLRVFQAHLSESVRMRGLDEAAVERAFAQGMFRSEEAERMALVDAACYPDDLARTLGGAKEPAARWMSAPRFSRWSGTRLWRPVSDPGYIGVVAIKGAIGLEPSPVLRMGGLDGVIAHVRAARRDPRVRGVLLHIDSPGGSALASDLIHREVARLAQRKPVVAFLGEVAASGGYYIAAAAGAIIAQPTTITGSIGVISARVVAAQVLERLQIRVETLRMAPHADLFSPTRDSTDEERALLERHARLTYRRFVQVVAAGRGLEESQVDAVGQGRVWSAAEARGHGLIDGFGGGDTALEEVRSRVPGLASGARARLQPRVMRVRRPEHVPPTAAVTTDEVGGRGDAGLEQLWHSMRVLRTLTEREYVLYCAPQLWRVD